MSLLCSKFFSFPHGEESLHVNNVMFKKEWEKEMVKNILKSACSIEITLEGVEWTQITDYIDRSYCLGEIFWAIV